MAIMAMVQWKGGVGKSTLAVHLATALNAVLIDLEPWGGATSWWAGPHAASLWQAPGTAPVLRALARGVTPRPRVGRGGRPALVPSHEQLLALTDGTAPELSRWGWGANGSPTLLVPTAEGPRPIAEALREALPKWEKSWNRHVLVDTPAGFGPLADGAVAAADVALLPVTLDQWAVPALRKFMQSYAPRIRHGLVIPNRVRSRRNDDLWAQLLLSQTIVELPFVVGPPIEESEILHVTPRPLTSGPKPGSARESVLGQIAAVAQRALELVTQ